MLGWGCDLTTAGEGVASPACALYGVGRTPAVGLIKAPEEVVKGGHLMAVLGVFQARGQGTGLEAEGWEIYHGLISLSATPSRYLYRVPWSVALHLS